MALDFPASPTDGQIFDKYQYDATTGVWRLTPVPVQTLGSLADVTETTPEDGQVLKYDGTEWSNQEVATNTDGNPGGRIFAGATDPSTLYTLQAGDVWIELP